MLYEDPVFAAADDSPDIDFTDFWSQTDPEVLTYFTGSWNRQCLKTGDTPPFPDPDFVTCEHPASVTPCVWNAISHTDHAEVLRRAPWKLFYGYHPNDAAMIAEEEAQRDQLDDGQSLMSRLVAMVTAAGIVRSDSDEYHAALDSCRRRLGQARDINRERTDSDEPIIEPTAAEALSEAVFQKARTKLRLAREKCRLLTASDDAGDDPEAEAMKLVNEFMPRVSNDTKDSVAAILREAAEIERAYLIRVGQFFPPEDD